MSKQSRRPGRRNRAGRLKFGQGPTPLKVVIATSPKSSLDGPTVREDVSLVRSAILYADHVELVSPAAAMLGSVAGLASGDEENLFQFLLSLDDETMSRLNGGGQLSANWREAIQVMTAMTPDQWDIVEAQSGEVVPGVVRSAGHDFRAQMTDSLGELRTMADGLLQTSGVGELVPAIEAGLVSLSPAGTDKGDTDDMVHAYVEILRRHLMDPRVHLMFDEQTASLVGSLIDEEVVRPSRLALVNAGQAAIGSGMIARLPAFPNTPLDELLDLRSDLDDPLARYRRAVSQMAVQLRVRAFDSEMPTELDDIWRTQVDPALRDVREGLAQHGLVREVARSLATDAGSVVAAVAGATVSVGLSALADLNALVPLVVGTAAPAAAVLQQVAKARVNQNEARRMARTHDLYYLYQLDQRTPGA
jgi:hypothetical protein